MEGRERKVNLRISIPNTTSSTSILGHLCVEVYPKETTWLQVFEGNNFEIPNPNIYNVEALRNRKGRKNQPVKANLQDKICKLLAHYRNNATHRLCVVHLVLKQPNAPRAQLIVPDMSTLSDRHIARRSRRKRTSNQQPAPNQDLNAGSAVRRRCIIL